MTDTVVRVKFHASSDVSEWTHRIAYKAYEPDEGSPTGSTLKVHGPDILKDGDVRQMSPWDADWLVQHYPDNFEVLETIPVDPFSDAFDVEDASYRALQKAVKALNERYELSLTVTGTTEDLRDRVRDALDTIPLEDD